MLDTETRIIDEKQFKVTQFSFWTARELEGRVLDIVLPLLAELTGSFTGIEDIDNISLDTASFDGEALAKTIKKLFLQLTAKERKLLIKFMFKKTVCVIEQDDRETIVDLVDDNNFDIVFGTNMFTMFKVIAFVAEVNYPDYFGKARGIGSKIVKTLSSKLGGGSTKEQ